MNITLLAVGRLRKSPELALIDDYLDRYAKTGRNLGLPPVHLVEVEDKRGSGMAGEAPLIERALPPGAFVVMMDERGEQPSSPISPAGSPICAIRAAISASSSAARTGWTPACAPAPTGRSASGAWSGHTCWCA